MLRARYLLAWLMMALVPLQGLAAASKICCALRGADQHVATYGEAAHAPAVVRSHHHVRAPGTPPPGSGALAQPVPGVNHDAGLQGCGHCAALCHAVGITATPALVSTSQPAHQPPRHLVRWIASRPVPVADKPPRT